MDVMLQWYHRVHDFIYYLYALMGVHNKLLRANFAILQELKADRYRGKPAWEYFDVVGLDGHIDQQAT